MHAAASRGIDDGALMDNASRVALLALGLLPLVTAAADEPADEIIVRGTPTKLAIDAASLRIDLKEYARLVALNVSEALAKEQPRVATADARERG